MQTWSKPVVTETRTPQIRDLIKVHTDMGVVTAQIVVVEDGMVIFEYIGANRAHRFSDDIPFADLTWNESEQAWTLFERNG